MEKEKTKVVHRESYSLEPEYAALLKKFARQRRTSKTGMLRILIDKHAIETGARPVASVETERK